MADKNSPTVVEDFLDEDADISGQRYVLLSFTSPEKVLEKKELFFFKKFLESYEVDWKIKNLEKYHVSVVQTINDQLDERIKQLEKDNQMEQASICRMNKLNITTVMNDYEQFIKKNHDEIQKTISNDSLSIKEIKEDSLLKLKKKRYLYMVDKTNFLPFENNENKYFSQSPILIKGKEKIDNVYNYLKIT